MALTTHLSQTDKTQTPYQIDPDQTLRASQALLKHVRAEVKKLQTPDKKNLFAPDGSDDENENEEARPVWLNLTTKQYITDKHKLKPSKIVVPHSLNANPNGTICLITADPQRAVKNVVADKAFPQDLASRITKIIGFTKLTARYKGFEERRQLLNEHDVFLADDRIISRLPKALGKVFYKGTAKRPIPIVLTSRQQKKEEKKDKESSLAPPAVVAKEIEKALACVPVTLAPGYNISVRAALESFTPQQVQSNVSAVATAIIDKHVAGGWKNVKSIHIKTPTSIALPIWLAQDLWSDAVVVAAGDEAMTEEKDDETEAMNQKRKRNTDTRRGPQSGERKKAKLAENKANEKVDAAKRKERLAAQKASAFEAGQ